MKQPEICRFFIGDNSEPTDQWNTNCNHPKHGGNCDDPNRPCSFHYDTDEDDATTTEED